MDTVMWAIILCGLLSIVYGAYTVSALMASDAGTPRMREIAAAIQEGAEAYLARQYTTIGVVGAAVFVIIGLLLGWLVALGFLIGAVLSGPPGTSACWFRFAPTCAPRRPRPDRWLTDYRWRSAPAP